jgi:hypothetical protein
MAENEFRAASAAPALADRNSRREKPTFLDSTTFKRTKF